MDTKSISGVWLSLHGYETEGSDTSLGGGSDGENRAVRCLATPWCSKTPPTTFSRIGDTLTWDRNLPDHRFSG